MIFNITSKYFNLSLVDEKRKSWIGKDLPQQRRVPMEHRFLPEFFPLCHLAPIACVQKEERFQCGKVGKVLFFLGVEMGFKN